MDVLCSVLQRWRACVMNVLIAAFCRDCGFVGKQRQHGGRADADGDWSVL